MRIINFLKALTYASALLFSAWLGAQSVSGSVSDDYGPLDGVEVKAINANVTTVTDFDGNFTLQGVKADDTLEFVRPTGESIKEAVNGRTVINVVLNAQSELKDVVAIGFGTIKRKDATGALESLTTDEFNKGVTTSPDQLLQGKMAGVQVTTNSGEPGSGSAIRIRGNNSIKGGNDPLYIIDGVPFNTEANAPAQNNGTIGSSAPLNPLNFINNADIESITVLKDASATAIYGTRAANGVILINTKKGLKLKPIVSFNSAVSFSSVARKLKLLSASEFKAANPSQDYGSNVDPFKSITKTGVTQDYQFSMRGGNDKQAYRFSLGALDQAGVIKRNILDKYNASTFLSQKLFDDRLTLSTNVNFTQLNNKGVANSDNVGAEGNLLTSTYAWNPTRSFYNADGSYLQPSNNTRNPLALLNYFTARSKSTRIFGNLTADVQIIKGLSYKFIFGADNLSTNSQTGISRLLNVDNVVDRGSAKFVNENFFSKYFENTLNFDRDLSSSLNLKATLGQSFEKRSYAGTYNTVRDFKGYGLDDQNEYIENQYLGATRLATEQASFSGIGLKLNSYFLRTIFDIKNKYIITATVRADGSSKFGKNNRYGTFPSVSAAWKMDQEGFLPSYVTEAKLRLGWGLTGNQSFPATAARDIFRPFYNADGNIEFARFQFANENLKWEASNQVNVGLDFGINNRLTGSFDYFHKKTNDLLYRTTPAVPAPTGSFYWSNLKDEIINSGVEIGLNYDIFQKADLKWSAGVNMAFLKNKIKGKEAFKDPVLTGNASGQGLSGTYLQVMYNGYAMNTFYLQKFSGFDANGDPILSDPEYVGNPNPKFNLGFNTSLNYKNFDFILNTYGSFGFHVYNNTANALFYQSALTRGSNVTRDVVNNGEGANAAIQTSTRFLEKGNFFRLANLTLGYTLGDDVFGGITWLNSLRVYMTIQNLAVITKYKGYDPEVNTNKPVDDIPSYGIDFSSYPKSRTFTFGINLNF